MSAVYGITKTGKKSKHTLDNTGLRRFLVVEMDPKKWELIPPAQQTRFASEAHYAEAKRDEHTGLLLHLARFLPLVLVVNSAGKSLHGWFFCANENEARLLRFMRYAVNHGADPATWTKSQLVRMPDGLRDNGKRQAVMFYNPEELTKQ